MATVSPGPLQQRAWAEARAGEMQTVKISRKRMGQGSRLLLPLHPKLVWKSLLVTTHMAVARRRF